MIVATDVGKGMGAVCKLDGGVVADVQVVQGRQRCADKAEVEAVMGYDEFTKTGEGYWQDEIDVVVICNEILNG